MAGKQAQSCRDLEIWKLAHELAVRVHKMSLEKLPKFEMYEEGSQIRRSSKSVASNIVEGFGRKRYKNEYIKFLTYALASCSETLEHLEMLFETGSLTDKVTCNSLRQRYDLLGKKINSFRQAVITAYWQPADQIGPRLPEDTD